jgi:hypothetical protein
MFYRLCRRGWSIFMPALLPWLAPGKLRRLFGRRAVKLDRSSQPWGLRKRRG